MTREEAIPAEPRTSAGDRVGRGGRVGRCVVVGVVVVVTVMAGATESATTEAGAERRAAVVDELGDANSVTSARRSSACSWVILPSVTAASIRVVASATIASITSWAVLPLADGELGQRLAVLQRVRQPRRR